MWVECRKLHDWAEARESVSLPMLRPGTQPGFCRLLFPVPFLKITPLCSYQESIDERAVLLRDARLGQSAGPSLN